jgi:hypothetical protein
MLVKTLIAVVLIVLLGYGLLKAEPLLVGPTLSLSTPTDGAHFPDGMVTVAGNAKRATQLTLNGAPLLSDQNGSFETALAFPKGTSILTIVAKDRFGKTITNTRTIVVP